jgi:hypothetical protein
MADQASARSLLLTCALLGGDVSSGACGQKQVRSSAIAADSKQALDAADDTGLENIETQFKSFARQKLDDAKTHAKAVFSDQQTKSELWSRLDMNGNGIVSCAEIDKMVMELSRTSQYGGFFQKLDHKPAIMRAYMWTTKREACSDGDDWVERKEFNALLKNLYFFNDLWTVFESADEGHDRRIDIDEFKDGLTAYGMEVNESIAQQLFARFDADHGGQILFAEFCEHFMSLMEQGATSEGGDHDSSAAQAHMDNSGDADSDDGTDGEDDDEGYSSEDGEAKQGRGGGEEEEEEEEEEEAVLSPALLLLGRGQRAKVGVEGPWHIQPSTIVQVLEENVAPIADAPMAYQRNDMAAGADSADEELQSYAVPSGGGGRLLPSEALILSHCHESKVEGMRDSFDLCLALVASVLVCAPYPSSLVPYPSSLVPYPSSLVPYPYQELSTPSCMKAFSTRRHNHCCAMLGRSKRSGINESRLRMLRPQQIYHPRWKLRLRLQPF